MATSGQRLQFALERDALRQYTTLPEAARDAYQELILFPVQAMANLYDMYYAQAMNLALADKQCPEANQWATRCRADFRRDSLLCVSYNHQLAHGKWNGMMTQSISATPHGTTTSAVTSRLP